MRRLILGRLVKSARGVYEPAIREEDVLGACRQFLELNGARVFRAVERVPKCYRCGLWLGHSEKGMPDLAGYFHKGGIIPFWVEIKRPGGKLRPSQASWLAQATMDGAIAFKAESIQEMVEQFKKFDITLKGL